MSRPYQYYGGTLGGRKEADSDNRQQEDNSLGSFRTSANPMAGRSPSSTMNPPRALGSHASVPGGGPQFAVYGQPHFSGRGDNHQSRQGQQRSTSDSKRKRTPSSSSTTSASDSERNRISKRPANNNNINNAATTTPGAVFTLEGNDGQPLQPDGPQWQPTSRHHDPYPSEAKMAIQVNEPLRSADAAEYQKIQRELVHRAGLGHGSAMPQAGDRTASHLGSRNPSWSPPRTPISSDTLTPNTSHGDSHEEASFLPAEKFRCYTDRDNCHRKRALLDSGAAETTISDKLYTRLTGNDCTRLDKYKARLADGSVATVYGVVNVRFMFDCSEKLVKLPTYVLPGLVEDIVFPQHVYERYELEEHAEMMSRRDGCILPIGMPWKKKDEKARDNERHAGRRQDNYAEASREEITRQIQRLLDDAKHYKNNALKWQNCAVEYEGKGWMADAAKARENAASWLEMAEDCTRKANQLQARR